MQSWRDRTHCSNLEYVIQLPILQEKRKSRTKMLFKCWKAQVVPWSRALEHITNSSGGCSRKQRVRWFPKGLHPCDQGWGSHTETNAESPVFVFTCVGTWCALDVTVSQEWLTKRTDSGKLKERKRTTRTWWHLAVQEEVLLGVFTSRAKNRGSVLFQGFAITRARGKWPLTCSFLTPSTPAECGTSPCVLTGKCCHLNLNAVSRALIKLMDQVGIETVPVLWSTAVKSSHCSQLPAGLFLACPAPRHTDCVLLVPWHLLGSLLQAPVS